MGRRRSKHRPPRLPDPPPPPPAPPPSVASLLRRSKAAGRVRGPGPAELAHVVARVAAGDRAVLGGLAAIPGVTVEEVWAAAGRVWGVAPEAVEVDPELTIGAARAAAIRLATVAAAGGRVAFATAVPASLLPLYLHLASLARRAGAELVDEEESGDLRVDGRRGRRLRWLDGVAVVTDGRALFDTADPEAGEEFVFYVPRPSLLVADGPFAACAVERGVPVVAFAGPDQAGLAVAAERGAPIVVVPVDPRRPPRAYRPLLDVVDEAFAAALGETSVT